MSTRISWFRLFAELKDYGLSLYAVEHRLDVPKSTIISWKAGVEPKHADGERLIQLWEQVTGKQRGCLPTEQRYLNAYRRRK